MTCKGDRQTDDGDGEKEAIALNLKRGFGLLVVLWKLPTPHTISRVPTLRQLPSSWCNGGPTSGANGNDRIHSLRGGTGRVARCPPRAHLFCVLPRHGSAGLLGLKAVIVRGVAPSLKLP